ncbi:MAG: SDR family NAD(P)-dependent oxidoreductase [Myxococcota bacterium]
MDPMHAKKWTAEDMPDLTGQRIIVTGANSGIGYEATLHFALRGASVTLACRNMDKGKRVLHQILAADERVDVELMALDLATCRACVSSRTRMCPGTTRSTSSSTTLG